MTRSVARPRRSRPAGRACETMSATPPVCSGDVERERRGGSCSAAAKRVVKPCAAARGPAHRRRCRPRAHPRSRARRACAIAGASTGRNGVRARKGTLGKSRASSDGLVAVAVGGHLHDGRVHEVGAERRREIRRACARALRGGARERGRRESARASPRAARTPRRFHPPRRADVSRTIARPSGARRARRRPSPPRAAAPRARSRTR